MRDAYLQLDKRIQRWVFNQGWHELREIQSKAIAPILSGKTDVLISASTASGKTEAFFLPACSALLKAKDNTHNNSNLSTEDSVGILYISPLKALINDQYRRLQSLAELIDMQITPWHGDSSKSGKDKQKKSPSGIILITPESLESLLIREAGWFNKAFSGLKYIVIDEFHAFIGSERGQHLLSLLARLEHLINRMDSPIPRVALSATLGELASVPKLLRPNQSLPCEIIEESEPTSSIKVQVKGYIEPDRLSLPSDNDMTGDDNEKLAPPIQSAEQQICHDLFKFCRGGSHLIFANSRKRTELIATNLTDLCEQQVVPNEFFPHHGSLSKELRESLEKRLQKEDLPTTAVCTMTLELGIDIGKVDTVVQVTAPHSISSLRQRLGRSGRRGGSSVLRMLISEKEITKDTNLVDNLRLELIQSLAMIRLLIISKWFEPADTSLYHFSTLLHQVLATIAQWGGVRADQLYVLLCQQGVFQKISIPQFKQLLKHMGTSNLITQLGDGQLVLGTNGESLVSHYTFYSVFKTPEEYRIASGTKTLGTIPIDSPIIPNQYIIFGGKRWIVKNVDAQSKVIEVTPIKGGGSPPNFGGSGMSTHARVRQEMLTILRAGDYRIQAGDKKVDFIDATARGLFEDSINTFNKHRLHSKYLTRHNGICYLFPWDSDKVVNTLSALLLQHDFSVESYAGVISVSGAELKEIEQFLQTLSTHPLPTAYELAQAVPDKTIDKFDKYLPEELLTTGYGARMFDVEGLREWLRLQNTLS